MSAGFEHKLIARFSRSSCFLWPCTLLSNMLETFSVLNTGRAVTFRQLYSNSRANKKVIKHFLISCGPPYKSKNVISFESASKFISNESEICNTFSSTTKLFTFFDWVENMYIKQKVMLSSWIRTLEYDIFKTYIFKTYIIFRDKYPLSIELIWI